MAQLHDRPDGLVRGPGWLPSRAGTCRPDERHGRAPTGRTLPRGRHEPHPLLLPTPSPRGGVVVVVVDDALTASGLAPWSGPLHHLFVACTSLPATPPPNPASEDPS